MDDGSSLHGAGQVGGLPFGMVGGDVLAAPLGPVDWHAPLDSLRETTEGAGHTVR